MKILSRGKDYYDYLIGKYGIDDKIVLDRTVTSNPTKDYNYYRSNEIFSVWFCDWYIEGLCKNKDFYYPFELLKIETTPFGREIYKSDNEHYHLFTLRKLDFSLNREMNCPILFRWGKMRSIYQFKEINKFSKTDISKFPILDKIKFNKVFNPEEAYLELYNWLIYTKPIEEISDIDKIKGHGFDIKKSFRKDKK